MGIFMCTYLYVCKVFLAVRILLRNAFFGFHENFIWNLSEELAGLENWVSTRSLSFSCIHVGELGGLENFEYSSCVLLSLSLSIWRDPVHEASSMLDQDVTAQHKPAYVYLISGKIVLLTLSMIGDVQRHLYLVLIHLCRKYTVRFVEWMLRF